MSCIYKNIYFVILITFLFNNNVFSENIINSPSGGFVVLLPNGSFDESGMPLGDRYTGSMDNHAYWSTGTNYIATGGSGTLEINNNDDTIIYLENSINRQDEDASGTSISTSTGFTSDLIIKAVNPAAGIKTEDNNSSLINIQNAGNVTIEGGSYDNVRRSGSSGTYTLALTSVDNLVTIRNATIDGPSVDQAWVAAPGGVGLQLNSLNETILENVSISGGDGRASSNWGWDDPSDDSNSVATSDLSGGTALTISGSHPIYATNLTAIAGQAGSANISVNRNSNLTVNVTHNGGNGITGSAVFNILGGEIKGANGSDASTYQFLDGNNFSITASMNGGSGIDGSTVSGIISNVTMIAGHGGKGFYVPQSSFGTFTVDADGGNGFEGSISGGSISGTFTGGNGGHNISFNSSRALINASGGKGLDNESATAGSIYGGFYTGGSGATNLNIITSGSTANTLTANGDDGFGGAAIIYNGTFRGGNGGRAIITGTNSTTANLNAGHGASFESSSLSNTNIIWNGLFEGGDGGTININNGIANANAGHGISQTSGMLIIHDGTFKGGNGGQSLNQSGSASAESGTGAFLSGGETIINGGTYVYGSKGSIDDRSTGPANSFENSAIYISGSSSVIIQSNAYVRGNITANDTSLTLNDATVDGNISLNGGSITLNVDASLNLSGQFIQNQSSVSTELDDIADGTVFKDLNIQSGTHNFSVNPLITANNAKITLGSSSSIIGMESGATLSPGTQLKIGQGVINSDNDLIVDSDAYIEIGYDGSSGGNLNVNGSLNLDAANARVHILGTATNSSGSNTFGSITSISDLNKITAEFGWLVNETISTNSSTLQVDYNYNSITNFITQSEFINTNHANFISGYITTNTFELINALGAKTGSEFIRYSEIQESDVADGILSGQQQINTVISARNTEVRARHGFASSKHQLQKPKGVSGPKKQNSKAQGWIRGYQSSARYEASATFSHTKLQGYGTVLGIDKYYDNFLIGIAGGFSRSDVNATSIYSSNTDAYSASIYSTIGGRNSYLDFAFTTGTAETKLNNIFGDDQYDSYIYSMYIGGGKTFDFNDRMQVTPEISFLYSKYDQDAYTRSGYISKNINDYSTESKLLSMGINISTRYQIDWYNRGLAMIPEFRLHWLHELNPELKDISYTTDVSTFSNGNLKMRGRDENVLKLGMGMNCWNWYYQNIKFEADYDLTMGEDYTEHLISAKVGYQF